jgi:hypothetical protein
VGKMGVCGTFWRKTKLMVGNYPSCRRHRGPARRFTCFYFVRSPRARLKKPGMAWVRRMDESPNPDENEKSRTRLDPSCRPWRQQRTDTAAWHDLLRPARVVLCSLTRSNN